MLALRPIVAGVILLFVPTLAFAQAPAPEATPAPDPAAATATTPAAAPVPAADSATLANNALVATIIQLRLRQRIAARIEQVVDMLNQKFELKGTYYKDTGNRVRLQLDLQGMGDNASTMLQVCDGKVLWEYQRVLGMKNYRKRDIIPILKKLEDPGLDDDFRGQVMTQLGFGGPEALLSGFALAIGFDQFADQVVDGVPSFVLGGKWKKRDGLVGPNERQLSPTAPLPAYIPSNIQVFIDKEKLWPYRIEMIGVKPSMIAEEVQEFDKATGRPLGRARAQPKVDPTRITLRYTLLPESEIKPDEQFVFSTPRDASNLIDETEDFLRMLDGAIQYKLNEKKAKEAAGEAAGEPLIRTGDLSLPAAPAGGTAPIETPAAPK